MSQQQNKKWVRFGCLSAKWRYWRVFVYFHFFYNHIPHTQIYCSKLRMKFKCKKRKRKRKPIKCTVKVYLWDYKKHVSLKKKAVTVPDIYHVGTVHFHYNICLIYISNVEFFYSLSEWYPFCTYWSLWRAFTPARANLHYS